MFDDMIMDVSDAEMPRPEPTAREMLIFLCGEISRRNGMSGKQVEAGIIKKMGR